MKTENFLLLVAIFLLFFPSSGIITETQNKYGLMASEGMVAIQVANVQPTVDIVPEQKCTCKGTKLVKSPDGIADIKCPCKNCTCKKDDNKPQPDTPKKVCPKCGREDCPSLTNGAKSEHISPVVSSLELVNTTLDQQILWFTAKWCAPCQNFDKNAAQELRKANWVVDESEFAHIRKIDIDEHKDIYEKYANGQPLPAFVKVRQGKVIKIIIGNTTSKIINDFWYEK